MARLAAAFPQVLVESLALRIRHAALAAKRHVKVTLEVRPELVFAHILFLDVVAVHALCLVLGLDVQNVLHEQLGGRNVLQARFLGAKGQVPLFVAAVAEPLGAVPPLKIRVSKDDRATFAYLFVVGPVGA